jgi:hypothetical protein
MLIKSAPQPAGNVPQVNRQDSLKYGEYLVSLGSCDGCHTPAKKGEPVPGKRLAGGMIFKSPVGTVVSANITPDPDTGIGKYSEQDFLNKFYQYRKYVEQGPPKVGPESFDRIALAAMATPWVPRNPRKIEGPAQVREILDLAA